MIKVPILFIVFNRPDKTRKVLQAIAAYQPNCLYIAADGPRVNNASDIQKCQEVQLIIEEEVTWKCEKKHLKHDGNKGCREAVSIALTWFFKNEPLGIIIEDDCVPSQSFFSYAATLLYKYKDDHRVFSIAGSNFGFKSPNHESYFYSNYMNMWGWATWRRVAQQIDYDLNDWKYKSKTAKLLYLLKRLSVSKKEFDWGWLLFWQDLFDQVSSGKVDTWDFQWFFQQFKSSSLTIYPSVNLVYNIGFDEDATHTTNVPNSSAPIQSLPLPLNHPNNFTTNKVFDEEYIKKTWARYNRESILWHIRSTKIYKGLKGLLKGKGYKTP